jgi:hypothetical protein
MFDELQYRWALRKFLKRHNLVRRSYDQVPNEPDPDGLDFPKYTAGKELNFQTYMLDRFRSDYPVKQAHRYHVPIPDRKDDWTSLAPITITKIAI